MTERDFLNYGYRATQPLEPRLQFPQTQSVELPAKFKKEVVVAKDKKKRQLVAVSPRPSAGYGTSLDTGGMSNYKLVAPPVALMPKVVIRTPPLPPVEIGPTTIVPLEVAHPTVKLGSAPVPWTVGPEASLVAFAAAIPLGTLLIYIGKTVIAQIALIGLEEAGQRLLGSTHRGDVLVRAHTGKSAYRGTYVRPRGKGGENPPDDADSYNDPDDPSWWQFWTWF